jgi:hypothetical protein
MWGFFIINQTSLTIFVSIKQLEMKIEDIGKDIKLVLRKERVGTISEDKIGQSILAAEKDLYNELVAIYKTQKYFHEQLRPFVVNTDLTMTAGVNAIGSDIQALLSAEVKSGSNKYPARIVYDPEKFGVGSKLDLDNEGNANSIPDHLTMKELSVSAAETALSDHFIEAIGGFNIVGTESFRAVEIAPARWGSKDFKDILGDPEKPDEINHLNIVESTIASVDWTSGKADIPEGLVKLLSGTVVINNKDYEGVVVKPEDFDSKKLKDLVINGGLKNQLTKLKSTITITNGVGDLPDGFILDKSVFDSDGNEGIILDNEEFLDRANSVILTPDEEEPIGEIYDDKIRIAPDTIKSIDMYHYQFPTEKTPAFTVIGNKIHAQPEPTTDTLIRFVKDATPERSVFKIDGGKLTVYPTPTNFKLTYREYPTEKAAQVRYISSDIEVKPTTVTELTVSYLAPMTPAVYGTVNSAGNRGKEFDSVTSTDTTFGPNATQSIVAKALKYLGVPYKDQVATGFEKIQQGE